jgi:hydrogenase/urease accessory protein HupE
VLVAFALLLSSSLVTRPSAAHTIGLSQGVYRLTGSELTLTWTLARADLLALAPTLDRGLEASLNDPRSTFGSDIVDAAVFSKITVTSTRAPCALSGTSPPRATEGDGLTIAGRYHCSDAPEEVVVNLSVLDALPAGHRQLARVEGSTEPHEDLLTREHPSFVVGHVPTASRPRTVGFFGFFRMGAEHIATGADHLVFLFGLLLVRGRARDYLTTVTAFTVAHSVSLALAVLGVLTPSAKLVEPAIALSLVYVGVESFVGTDPRKRWRVTFPFGLVHGFGFASALREIGLSRAEVPRALVSFNLGVEAAQLVLLALALPLLHVLVGRSSERARERFRKGASVLVVLAGAVWFVVRIAGSA